VKDSAKGSPQSAAGDLRIDMQDAFPSLSRHHIDNIFPSVSQSGCVLCADMFELEPYIDKIAQAFFADDTRLICDILPKLSSVGSQAIQWSSLSVRMRKGLKSLGIYEWKDVLQLSIHDFKCIRGLGQKSIVEFLVLAVRVSLDAITAVSGGQAPYSLKTADSLAAPTHGFSSPELNSNRIRYLAQWARLELGVTRVGEVCEFASGIELPIDISKQWELLSQVGLAEFSEDHEDVDLGELVNDCCDKLNERELTIFLERLSNSDAPTLQELADQFGITRERVRQLELGCGHKLIALTREQEYVRIGWRANTIRRDLGLGVPMDGSYCTAVLQQAIRGISKQYRDIALKILLWLAGPYQIKGDRHWLSRGPIPDHKFVNSVTNANGVVDLAALSIALNEVGLVKDVHNEWTEQFGLIRIINDIPIQWTGSIPDKAALILECWRRPATPEDINKAIDEGHDNKTTRYRIFDDDRFMRTSRSHVALRKWCLEEYSGIAEEIVQEIDRAGGSILVETLVTRLVTQFGSNEQSIRMYLNAPMFIVDCDSVRCRSVDDGFDIEDTITDVPGCYLVANHRLNLSIRVTADILRGSGTPLPRAVASWLGVVPGKRQLLLCNNNQVLVNWLETATSGPTLGSIREPALHKDCREGDTVLLCFANDEMTLELLPNQPSKIEAATNTKSLAIITGLPLTGDYVVDQRILRYSLGIKSMTRSIAGVLRSRGDQNIANLVCEEIPQALDAAIDGLGEYL